MKKKDKYYWKHVTARMAWDMYHEEKVYFEYHCLHYANHSAKGFKAYKRNFCRKMRMSEKQALHAYKQGDELWDRKLYSRRTHRRRAIWWYF